MSPSLLCPFLLLGVPFSSYDVPYVRICLVVATRNSGVCVSCIWRYSGDADTVGNGVSHEQAWLGDQETAEAGGLRVSGTI